MNIIFILLLIILVVLLACLIGLYSSPICFNHHIKFGGDIPNPNKSEFLKIREETLIKPSCPKVYKKAKQTKSKGVEDIHQLPLDWFSKVRQTYKQNQIIPRQKGKKE